MSFLSYLINGISLGSVYAIIALGYTMVYGIAQYAEFRTRRYHHGRRISQCLRLSQRWAVLRLWVFWLRWLCVRCWALAIERVAYRPLRDASPLAVLITAIGVSYLLQNVALLIFGSNARQFTSVITVPALKLAGRQAFDLQCHDRDDFKPVS